MELPEIGKLGFPCAVDSRAFLSITPPLASLFWMQTVWEDPYCGDGRCDNPLEFPAFGNLGCAVDCGRFANVTTIRVVMSTNFHSEADRDASSWNLCLVYPSMTAGTPGLGFRGYPTHAPGTPGARVNRGLPLLSCPLSPSLDVPRETSLTPAPGTSASSTPQRLLVRSPPGCRWPAPALLPPP